jgi:hypothetical protein
MIAAEEVISRPVVLMRDNGGPRRIADDLLPTNGSNVYILGPDGEIDQPRELYKFKPQRHRGPA